MSSNSNLRKADKEKNDEFYTRYEDIEKECMRYKDQFHGKTIFCNCDDPEWSNFWQFFHRNFSFFQLKKLISTHYVKNGSSYVQIYDGTRDKKNPLNRDEKIDNNECMNLFDMCSFEESNGDFRSPECLKYLEEADIVVTNPPFSLFREFITTLIKYDKKFLVWGNNNALTYKEIFPLIKDNKMWLGYIINSTCAFKVPEGYKFDEKITKKINDGNKYGSVPSISVFTNLNTTKRNEELILYKEYNEEDYPHYDNYNAINVNKTAEIPCDYFGYMGVPITFIGQYNPEQFEIIDGIGRYSILNNEETKKAGKYLSMINGEALYFRVIVRRKYDNEGRLVKDYYDENGNLIK